MDKEEVWLSQNVAIAPKLMVTISAKLGFYKTCFQPYAEHLLCAGTLLNVLDVTLFGSLAQDYTASTGQSWDVTSSPSPALMAPLASHLFNMNKLHWKN